MWFPVCSKRISFFLFKKQLKKNKNIPTPVKTFPIISLNVALNWNDGFYMGLGFLPVFASFQYSVVILFPNIKVPYIKASMAISCVCWTVYGLFLKNYSMAISNVIIFIAAIVAVIRYYVSIRNQELEEPEEK